MLSSSSGISAMFFTRDGEIYSRLDQKSYSKLAMTPPERIAVQQSYNLLTAISLGGVRPI